MTAKENKGAEEALNSELKEMDAADGEFGEVEPLEGLIADDEAEEAAGGYGINLYLPMSGTTRPGWTYPPYRT